MYSYVCNNEETLSVGWDTTLMMKATASSETSVHITHTTRCLTAHSSQWQPQILHVLPRRRKKRRMQEPFLTHSVGTSVEPAPIWTQWRSTSEDRSPADQPENFSYWFTAPFVTFLFNKVGSSCNLRLIFINGLEHESLAYRTFRKPFWSMERGYTDCDAAILS
jgi:hypothetical protein